MEAESAAKERTEPSGKLAFSDFGLFCREAGRRTSPRRKSRERGRGTHNAALSRDGKTEGAEQNGPLRLLPLKTKR